MPGRIICSNGIAFTEKAKSDTLNLISINFSDDRASCPYHCGKRQRKTVCGDPALSVVTTSNESDVAREPAQKGSAVARILDILEAVAAAERPITPAELTVQLDIPKATVHRLCISLEEQGFLQSPITGRGLLPGKRFNKVAMGVLASAPFWAQRHAILTHLSAEIGETCNISVPDGSAMIYFDRAETHWPVRIQLNIGSRVPIYSTAAGKMYLSTLPVAKQQRILDNTHLVANTPTTFVTVEELMAELALTRERGYALDNEEYIEGMVGIAVPLSNTQGRLYATLSVHAPCMRITLDDMPEHLPKLQRAADELEHLLED